MDWLGVITSYIDKLWRFVQERIIHTKLFWRLWWWIKNEKLEIEIKETRTYNGLYESLPSNFNRIISKAIREYFEKIEDSVIGKNYAIVQVKGLNVPLKIEILPEIGPTFEDDALSDGILGTVVSVKTFGTLIFTYRESKNYEKLIYSIDKIFKNFEEKYNLTPKSTRYQVLVSFSNKKPQRYPVIYEQTPEWNISLDDVAVLINSKTKDPLIKIFTEYLPAVKIRS